jgi:hypothetical protein
LYIDSQVLAAETAKTDAETAETGAQAAEANTLLLEASVIATANFKGLWSDLTGALSKPASVAHNGLVWLLLNNLADVTASEPSSGNTDWQIAVSPPTSASIDVTANANGITLGNVVELVTDGAQNVQNIYHCEAPTIGSLLTLDGTNNVKDLALSRLTDTTVLAAWNDDTANLGQLAILTAGSPPTMSAVVATSTNDDIRFSSSPLSSTEVALAYNRTGSSSSSVRIATISGTNITPSAIATIDGEPTISPSTCALTNSNFFVACVDSSTDCQIRTAVSNGTNAPTLGTALNVNGTNNANYLSLANTSSTTAMLVLQNSSDSNGEIAHIAGGTTNAPTASTLAHLDGTNNCTYITQSPIDSNHTLCAYNNATTSNGCLAVIQANGANAPTVISRAVFESVAVRFCSLSAHQADIHSLTYSSTSNNLNYVSPVKVDTNYNITIGQKLSYGDATSTSYNAIAALSLTTSIAAFQGNGADGFAGTLTLTPTPVISGQLLGIAETSATNGATASVAIGPIVEGTYTSGADYYAAGSGGIGETASPVRVGKAKTTTELVLDLGGNPSAGKVLSGEITVPGAFTWTAPYDGEYVLTFCGGGASGAYGGGTSATGGNGGNTVSISRFFAQGSSVSGSLGAGGASKSSTSDGSDGADSTVIISGVTLTAKGGRKGWYLASNPDYSSANLANAVSKLNIPGSTGSTIGSNPWTSTGGAAPLITETLAITSGASLAGVAGSRGGGGTSAMTGSSGKGGDAIFRWELVIGS